MLLPSGTKLGPYEIVARLARGGMGEIYRARDPRLQRDVAIKVLPPDAAADRDRLRRFIAEARAASALNHPNILTVHEIGEAEWGPYIVTELVEGNTIRELVAEQPLGVLRALDVAIQAAEGVAKAHEAGIIHRDLKPENLMLSRDGFVKVLDFGLVKLLRPEEPSAGETAREQSATASGMIVGTVGYISPEQLAGRAADARSDVFSLGVVLYEMLSGANPFRGETPAQTISAILRDNPPPLTHMMPNAPGELARVTARALAKKPEERYETARQFAAELRQIRARLESLDSPTVFTPGARPAPFGLRRIGLLLVAPLVVAAAIGGWLWLRALTPAPMDDEQAPVSSLPAGRLAVAVMPIQDQTADPELERAGVGRILTDALVQTLHDSPRLYVVSPIRLDGVARSLGRPLADAGQDLAFARAVSERANAGAMLSGTLAQVSGTYVLNVLLTELPSEKLLGTFRAETRNAADLLQDLTLQVNQGLQRRLEPSAPPPETEGAERVATRSVEAYAHVIRASDLTWEGYFKEGAEELKKAVAIDPDMGLAWSMLGCAYSFAGDDVSARAAQKRAEELLHRVNQKERRWIELNGIWVNTGNGELHRKAAEQYIQDYPDDRDAYFYAGLGAEYLENRCDDALSFYEKAYRLTPNYYPLTKAIVDCQLKLGQTAQAIQSLELYLAVPFIGEHGRAQARGRLKQLNQPR